MTLLTPAEMVAAIEACMTGRPGDRQEATVPPEPGWMSDADADVACGKDEDRRWRQWP